MAPLPRYPVVQKYWKPALRCGGRGAELGRGKAMASEKTPQAGHSSRSGTTARMSPAASAMGGLLGAQGLVPRSLGLPSPERPFREASGPNDVRCIEFGDWFRTGDGARCNPLTIRDAWSGCLLAVAIVAPRTEPVAAAVEAVFRRYGLPLALRSDSGAPFAGRGAGGLSRLSARWAKAGIALERIDPGLRPPYGRDEWMHRTLEAATKPPADSLAEQQARFVRFREEFNTSRPHGALGEEPPASFYRRSQRVWREPEEPVYDASHAVRRVRRKGCIKWGGKTVFVSEVLAGETVGVAATESGAWIVRFAGIDLGMIDPRSKSLERFPPARRSRRETEGNTATGMPATGR